MFHFVKFFSEYCLHDRTLYFNCNVILASTFRVYFEASHITYTPPAKTAIHVVRA